MGQVGKRVFGLSALCVSIFAVALFFVSSLHPYIQPEYIQIDITALPVEYTWHTLKPVTIELRGINTYTQLAFYTNGGAGYAHRPLEGRYR